MVSPPAGDGWVSCTGSIVVRKLKKQASSGYVAAFMNWGCPVGTACAAYFHGDALVGTGTPPDSFSVAITSTYLPRAACTRTMTTTVDLYNGRQGSVGAPLLYSIPATLNNGC